MKKVYRLFKWAVWTIETDEEIIEEEELAGGNLESSHTLSAGDRPLFGFTTQWEWEEYDRN